MPRTALGINGAPRALRVDEAAAIYDVLVELACASSHNDERSGFVRYATADLFVEWRFQGVLGFGGKLYADGWDVPYVGCYREDETPARRAVIDRVNARILALFEADSSTADTPGKDA
jgi:hypothetical protein